MYHNLIINLFICTLWADSMNMQLVGHLGFEQETSDITVIGFSAPVRHFLAIAEATLINKPSPLVSSRSIILYNSVSLVSPLEI